MPLLGQTRIRLCNLIALSFNGDEYGGAGSRMWMDGGVIVLQITGSKSVSRSGADTGTGMTSPTVEDR